MSGTYTPNLKFQEHDESNRTWVPSHTYVTLTNPWTDEETKEDSVARKQVPL